LCGDVGSRGRIQHESGPSRQRGPHPQYGGRDIYIPGVSGAYRLPNLRRLRLRAGRKRGRPTRVPFITYLACCRVLAATPDARARDILAQGHARLLAYAGRIKDEALRHSFLENVTEHRELRQLYMQ
jgi:hypothetical protein